MCLHLWFGRAVPSLLALVIGASLFAQDAQVPGGTTPPAAQDPAATPPAQPAQDGKATQGNPMASVLADAAKLRVWPTQNSPAYEGAFAKGQTLKVGRAEAGFREVLLPLGPTGFVHKSFTHEPTAEGKVAVKSKSVAFRYRPKSGEAPITTLPEGAELWVVGEQDDWWKVRNPAQTAWVPETEVQVFDMPPETMTLAYAEFEKVQAGEVGQRLESIAKAEADKKEAQGRREEYAKLQDDFAKELKKQPREQQLAPIAAAADSLLAKTQQDELLKPMVEELKRRVGAQQWVVEATMVRDEQPKPVEGMREVPPVVVPDALDRFQAIGFLRWVKGITGPGRYVVEKGGKHLFEVTCQSGRYDLSLFVDFELGLIGSSRRPNFESLRVLDVEKIEVLSARP